MAPIVTMRWDCHAHVFGPADRYPPASAADYEPPTASLEDYLHLLNSLGFGHGVLVQPSIYGFDNSCLLDGLSAAGGQLRGVAVPAPETQGTVLEAMHDAGVRAIRCNLINSGGLRAAHVMAWAGPLRDLGWHIQLQARAGEVQRFLREVGPLGLPVVIDHMGRPRDTRTGDTGSDIDLREEIAPLLAAMTEGNCYAKLSAPYRLGDPEPPWQFARSVARALINVAPDRCLWGSDWPHTEMDRPVNTLECLVFLENLEMTQTVCDAIFQETPARLYD